MGALRIDRVDTIAVIVFDLPGEPVNKFNAAVKSEFEETFAALGADNEVTGLAIISAKPDIFIAGADIEEFVALRTREEAEILVRDGQAMLNSVAAFPKPVVVGIHGACLGGGLELALAAHYRVASSHPKTQLGLPEVQLGIIPAAGGCQRLPRLVGLRAALDLILTGRSIRADKAFRLGLVDEVVPQVILRDVALEAARRLARSGVPRRRSHGLATALLEGNSVGRRLVFSQARRTVRRRSGGHYPAPVAALDAVAHGLAHGMTAGFDREARHFGELAVGEVSRKLVQIFFATTALKKDPGVEVAPEAIRRVERLGVVGAGFMGAAIGGVAVAQAGVDVRFRDADHERVNQGLKAARRVLDERRKRRRITRFEHQRLSALMSGTTDYSGFGARDFVVEAVFEDVEVKRQVVAELEAVVHEECVLASNTSTIPIARLQSGARHPGRVVGMHFFSPVEKMPLLEVISGPESAPWAVATAVSFGRRMGKTAIVVQDHAGFWVNRLLTPYLNEAGWLLAEGVRVEVIDRAMTRFGFPVGPITLLDEVGLDVAEKASKVMQEALGARMVPAPGVGRLVAAGRRGRKSGSGFYRYEGGKKKGVDQSVYEVLGISPDEGAAPTDLERRLVAPLLNEAAQALADGVVREPRDGDIGAIFGFGFPPFRGGPFRYLDDVGAKTVVADLERLAGQLGPRFQPAEPLVEMARSGARYYPT